MACAPSEDSDQPGHPPSLIRVFAVCMKKAWVLTYPFSADAQADLSLCWAHTHFVGFVMLRLIFCDLLSEIQWHYLTSLFWFYVADSDTLLCKIMLFEMWKYEKCALEWDNCTENCHLGW